MLLLSGEEQTCLTPLPLQFLSLVQPKVTAMLSAHVFYRYLRDLSVERHSSGVVVLVCFSLCMSCSFWLFFGNMSEFRPLRWIFLFFVLPVLLNMLLLEIRGKNNVVTVAGMCSFFLVIVRTSSIIFAVAWVEWFMSELFNFWSTWHFWPLIHQPFGITLLGRLKYCFISLWIFSIFLVIGITALGLPRGVIWEVSRWLSETALSGHCKEGLWRTVPLLKCFTGVKFLQGNFSFSYTFHFCYDNKTNQKY